MKKVFAVALIVLGIILAAVIISNVYHSGITDKPKSYKGAVVLPSSPPSPSPSVNPTVTETCLVDTDCLPDEVCKQKGPIVIDPITKKPLTGKVCIQKDSVIPF